MTLNMNVTPGTIVAPRMGPDGTLWVIVNMDGKGEKWYCHTMQPM
ncbi:hypothetical protein QKW52_28395 [Bacillus sonorensis]|nr:hypothetical protein [Bacillus sonorensis]